MPPLRSCHQCVALAHAAVLSLVLVFALSEFSASATGAPREPASVVADVDIARCAHRILFVSLEFDAAVFSGNGVYAQSLVRGLVNSSSLASAGLGRNVAAVAVDVMAHATAAGDADSDDVVERPPPPADGASVCVLALSAAPEDATAKSTADDTAGSNPRNGHQTLTVAVPAPKWKRLDRHAAWREFAIGASTARVRRAVDSFAPTALAFVDWSGLPAAGAAIGAWGAGQLHDGLFDAATSDATPGPEAVATVASAFRPALQRADPSTLAGSRGVIPATYLNFRVYSASAEFTSDPSDLLFYRRMEGAAVLAADQSVALSQRDAACLVSLDPSDSDAGTSHNRTAMEQRQSTVRWPSHVTVLWPSLRGDVHAIAQHQGIDERSEQSHQALQQAKNDIGGGGNVHFRAYRDGGDHDSGAARLGPRYLTCLVRHSVEKNAGLCATVVEHLAPWMRDNDVTPVVAGAAADAEYSHLMLSRIRAAMPTAVIVDRFLGPQELYDGYLRHAVLNLHPSLHDAFGMTVVETAALGVPSLVHQPPAAAAAPSTDSAQSLGVRVGAARRASGEGEVRYEAPDDPAQAAAACAAASVGSLELLRPGHGEALAVDMRDAQSVADAVKRLLGSPDGATELRAVARAARTRALSWTEGDCSAALLRVLAGGTASA